MKKITTLIATLAITAIGWQANAQFTENFEGTFLPVGWKTELPGTSAANDITQSTSANHTAGGTFSARFSSYNSASDYNQFLFSQQITVTAPNTELRFWHMKSGANAETLEWGVSTTLDTSTAVSVWTPVTLNTTWSEEIVDLSSYVGQTIYFAWHYYGNYQYYVYLDDISLAAPPACPAPTAQTVTNLTATSADLGWTENGTATAWDIEWDTTGFTQGTGTMVTGTTTNPYSLTGLTANTSYDFYVRANCGGANGTSTWVGPFTFITSCTATSAPWIDSVETHTATTAINFISNCWSASTSNSYGWNISGTGTTPSSGTGPTSAYSGTNFFFTEASGSTVGDVAELYTPFIDLTPLTSPYLEFYYHMFGNIMGDLYIDVFNGTTWTTVDSLKGQQQTNQTDPWLKIPINLSAFSGTIQIRFRAISGGDWESDMSIDNINVKEMPTCMDPSLLTITNLTATSADLGWTENGTATAWDIEWDTTGFTQGTGTMVTGTTTNPYSLTGLTANTSYDFYVRANCGGANGTSTWVGPFTFYTGYCIPSSSSASTYIDDFSTTNGSTNISNLTSGFTTGGYFDGTAQSVQSYATGTFDFNATIVGGTAGFSIWIDWNNDLVFDDATEKVFNTTAYGNGPFIGTITIPTATAIGSYRMRITTDWNQSNPSLPCGAQSRAEFEDYTINVIAAPTCLPPSALTATAITPTSASLSWTENGTATTWDIEWDTTGFTQGTGTMVTGTTTNPYSLTGLTASTSYDFYVRAACGGANGNSIWIGPFTFATPCVATTFPYSENFDGVAPLLPSCWTTNDLGEVTTTAGCSGSTNESLQINGVAGDYAYSPMIDLSSQSAVEVRYMYRAGDNTNCGNAPETADSSSVDYWNGTTWVNLAKYGGGGATPVVFTLDSFIISTGLTSTFQLRFFAISGSGAGFDNYNFDDLSVVSPTSVGINTSLRNLNLTIYPNPNNGIFTLNLNTTDVKELDIKVTNIEGQVVYTKNNFSNINHVNEQINLNNNAKGIYFVVITSDKGVVTRKIIVQ